MRHLIRKVDVPTGKRGPWTVERFTVPKKMNFARLRLILDGRPVEPGTYTRLVHQKFGLVMSDTQAEQKDHWEFIYNARGHVLITGLGLGLCIAACLRKPEVKHITVVEIDADLIALVGKHYQHRKVHIIQGDAFTWQPEKRIRYDAAWHDIWVSPSSEHLEDMTKLKRRFKADWKGCWMEHHLRRMKRTSTVY